MNTLSFQAPASMAKQLEKYAKQLDRSKAWIIRQAVAEYMEDLEDVIEAKRAMAGVDPKDYIPFEEVKRRLDLQ